MGKTKLTSNNEIEIIKLFKSGLDYKSIGDCVGLSVNTVYRYIKKKNLKSSDRVKSPKNSPNGNEINVKYNHLVIEKFEYDNKNHIWLAITKCDCGLVTKTPLRSLKLGLKKTCGTSACVYHYNLSIKNGKSTTTGYEEILGTLWSRWRLGAKKRDLCFEITIKDGWDKFINQDRKCALSGLELTFHKKYKDSEQTASLDRIDSKLGYTKDNIQWVHKHVNIMKHDLSEKEFIMFCKLIANKNEI